MTTATARKTALESEYLRNCDHLRLSHLVRILKCWQSELQLDWCARRLIKYRKYLRLYAQVVISTVKVVVSCCCFAEDSTDLFVTTCCTWRTLIFSTLDQSSFSFVALSLQVPSSILKLLNITEAESAFFTPSLPLSVFRM